MKLLLIRERKEKMKEIYQMTREEILQNQHVSEKGLTESRVQEIRQKIGENQLQATKKKSPVRIFAEQFQDFSRQKNRLILSRHFHHHMQKYFVMVKK